MTILLATLGFAFNLGLAVLFNSSHDPRLTLIIVICSAAFSVNLIGEGECHVNNWAEFVGLNVATALPWFIVPGAWKAALWFTAAMLGGPFVAAGVLVKVCGGF